MIYELKQTVLLKKNIHFSESMEVIGNYFNQAMLLDEKLKIFHKERKYKNYVFNNLFPFGKNGFYIKGNLYLIRLRSLDEEFLKKMQKYIKKVRHDYFHAISAEIINIKPRHITSLYTVSPVIITVDSQPFLPDDNINLLMKRLQANLEKKYKQIYGTEEFSEFFMERIEILNNKPIATKYKKNIKLLGNKMRIFVKPDEKSQILAQIAMGAGAGEKNSSIGAGFCFANYL